MLVQSPGQEDPLEENMAIHSSIPAWEIPRTEGHKDSDTTEWRAQSHPVLLLYCGNPKKLIYQSFPERWILFSYLSATFMDCLFLQGCKLHRAKGFVCLYYATFLYCSWGSQGKNTEVVCHSLLQGTTFCQNSLPWAVHLGWPYMAWLIISLS